MLDVMDCVHDNSDSAVQTLTFSMSLSDIPSKKGIHKILVFCLKKGMKLRVNAYFIPELRVKFYFYFFRLWSLWPIARWLTQLANSPVSDSTLTLDTVTNR